MLTVLIKTFKRPLAVNRLYASIKKYYPELPVDILDDSSGELFDIGVSRGRNILVNRCKTKYCIILDDDCVFTEKTDLANAILELENRSLDILQFKVPGLNYYGTYETKDGVVRYKSESRDGLYDFVAQIYLARTAKLKKYKWDEDLKVGEHFAYFYEHRGKLRIGVSEISEIEHHHIDNQDYRQYRQRALDYVWQYMKKKKIKQRIEL
jgi:hypothetical protein